MPLHLSSIFPIFLILLTCVWLVWNFMTVHLRRRWDSTASIINAFTAFLLISFSKIIFVIFTLLWTEWRIPHKTVQKVCLLLEIWQVACSAYVCGIISGTVQGWCSWLHDGLCILRIVLLPFFSTSPSIILTHQYSKVHFLHVPPVSMLSQDHIS